jgi:hypothetical protein
VEGGSAHTKKGKKKIKIRRVLGGVGVKGKVDKQKKGGGMGEGKSWFWLFFLEKK